MDYEQLIDAETWTFIRRIEGLAANGAAVSVAERRRAYGAQCQAFFQGRPEMVAVADSLADGVPVRIYTAGTPTRTVLFAHGGGYFLGGLDSHDDICAEICIQTGYRVVAVDYRLAPEHPHPAAFDDCWTAAQWALRQFDDGLVLAGDSAGGNLMAAVAHHARGRIDGILGQVLIYPDLGGDVDKPSFVEHAQAPMLGLESVRAYRALRFAGAEPDSGPTAAPLNDSDFSGLPPTVLVTADCDPLRDEARAYRDRLRAAQVPVCWINEAGLVHGYLRARADVTRAADSFERISIAIEALGQGLWPYEDDAD